MGDNSSRGILVRSESSGGWVRPATSTVSNEAELQELIAASPTLVPGVPDGSVAVTELRSGVGPADVCIVSPTGEITIVECKLASNAEVRRKIIGQVLDYASQIWGMTFHQLDARWRQRVDGLGIVEALGGTDFALSAEIEANLQRGSFDLVLAVDRINDDLRRIVEYINHITPSETNIVALELRYASHDGVEILVPSVFGSELAASGAGSNDSPSPTADRWLLPDVTDFLLENETEHAAFVTELFEGAAARGWTVIGTGAAEPSAIIGLDVEGGEIWPITIYTSSKGSVLSTNIQWTHRAPEANRLQFVDDLADRLPSIDRQSILDADLRKRPNHALRDVVSALSADELIDIVAGLADATNHEDPG